MHQEKQLHVPQAEANRLTEENAADLEALQRRRVPCMITYLHPFRLVETADDPEWEVTIEQVNTRGWDYVALHRLVGGVDVGLEPPYHLVVGRDGALALPPLEALRSPQAAVERFNLYLAALLLGGIYCEATTPDGLDLGSIIDWKYIRSHRPGVAAPNRFHDQIRRLQANPSEAIELTGPRRVTLSDLDQAMRAGLRMLSALPPVRGEYLLKGTTGLARLDWGAALANLWIVVEQLVALLWERHVVTPTVAADSSKTRRSQLADTRTWTASARIEMLTQKDVIPLESFKALATARKARNDLHHSGAHPTAKDAQAAYKGMTGLLVIALGGERPPLLDLDFADHSISDPFAPPRPLAGQPTHWMAIPKLPGEENLERAEAKMFRAKWQ